MKKYLVSFISLIVAMPLFATNPDISANEIDPSCNNSVLNTYSGSAGIEIDWEPNTINIEWYNGDQKITPSNNTANTCTYDAGLTIPTNAPSKTGYTFAGWKIKTASAGGNSGNSGGSSQSQCSFATLLSFGDETQRASKSISNGTVSTSGGASASTYGLSNNGDWGITLANGYVKGTALCSSSSSGDVPSVSSGNYCWCKAEQVQYFGENWCSVESSSWVHNTTADSIIDLLGSSCAAECASICSSDAQSCSVSGFCSALFGGGSGSNSGGGNSEVEPIDNEISAIID